MDKGNLLISASGKGHSTITTLWIMGVVGSILFIVIGFVVGRIVISQEEASMAPYRISSDNMFAGTSLGQMAMSAQRASANEAEEMSTFIMIMAVGVAILMLGYISFATSRTAGTAIMVYENAVCGKSVEHRSLELQLLEFELPYDKISSVDLIKNTIVINTASVRHKIYAMNAGRIRDAIMSRKA